MSPFEAHLKELVDALHRGWGKSWPADEWDKLLVALRPTLEMAKEAGGDPDFILFALVSFRWRSPLSKANRDYRDAARLFDSIKRSKRVRGRVWRELGKDLTKVQWVIEHILLEEGPSEEGASGREWVSPLRTASQRTYRCLLVLDQYLKMAIPPRKT